MLSFADHLDNGPILVFDGAMGTQIQELGLTAADFPDGRAGFNDGLTVSRPDAIAAIHRAYLKAGADCVQTNTFGSNRIKLDEYGFGKQCIEINATAARLARRECDECGRDAYAIGSVGPTGYLPSTNDADLGQIPLDKIVEAYKTQAIGLVQGGIDAILIETSQDILEVKLAIEGILDVTDGSIPLLVNVTLAGSNVMLLGTSIEAAYVTASGMDIDAFGINCSTGPKEMEQSVRWLAENSEVPVLVEPNAGMPINVDGVASYKLKPDSMAQSLDKFIEISNKIRMVGGCCGTTPAHTTAMRQMVDKKARK